MEMRTFGRSGMKISILGFGCGAVGGLMVRGEPADQERAIARAIDAGVNYFDTAALYGNGVSEKNLGRILNKLKPGNAIVGTKLRIPADTSSMNASIAGSIAASLEASLRRLQREQVDILHLHTGITSEGRGGTLSVRQVLDEVVPAFKALRQQGRLRFLGLTANGETPALHEVIDAQVFDSAQVTYNLLNPSAADELPPDYPAQDYARLFDRTKAAGVGVIGIRVLAGGALSGTAERHAIASPPPNPIGSARRYEDDLKRAQRLAPLVSEGYASSLAEAATRFCITHPAMGTILVGMATLQEFEDSLAAVLKGPLPDAALARLAELQRAFAGEAR
jgi:L-galactose dehydrogenase/L-glyceraldehyde 3-phosphate reductase